MVRFGVTPQAMLGVIAAFFIAAELALILRLPVPVAAPAPPVVDSDAPGAARPAAAAEPAAGWNLNATSAASPATVPPRVKTARRNGISLGLLEVERFVVDVPPRE